jgi:HD-GYP domain-containing protein (c-di-GMP phosphodiesterase class II)
MANPLQVVLGVAASGALLAREHKARVAMERFAGAALETLLNAIEANDPDTGMHVRRVAAYALIIAEAAGLDERCQHAVERIALFHDIGKIHEALFDIVHEPNKLTPAERRSIATHPARGAQVLAPLKAFYPDLPAGVLAHHERWDGTGYPRRLRGRRIPLEARIVSIADTFDAVAHTRRYRRGTGVVKAFEVICEGRGTQFDPELVDVMLLPPVREQITCEYDARMIHNKKRGGRRAKRHESIPDVTFRWRSESLGSSRLRSTHRVD